MHRLGRDRKGFTRCRGCGISYQSLVDHFGDATRDDYRVVCREPGCDYGDRVDSKGHGYTNHAALCLAVAAIRDHQSDVDDGPHDATIQQHPIPDVTENNS